MSELLKRKIEEQNRLWNRMQEIQRVSEEENRDWTAEERSNWDAANAKIDEVSADIERLERSAKIEKIDYRQVVQGQSPDEPEDRRREEDGPGERAKRYEEAFTRYMRGGLDNLRAEQRAIMLENRAQGTDVPADGGYLVPDGFRQTMTETMKAFGGLLNLANVITTTTGNTLSWPSNDSTSQVGAILAENTQISELDVTFGTKALGAYTYTSKLVRVSLQLLQDNAFNLEQWLPRKLGERIGRAVADDLVNGVGVGEPTGILAGATTGASIADGDFVTLAAASGDHDGYNALIDLEHSLDPAYRASPNCRFLMHDMALRLVRKYKDADGRPIWVPVPVPGMPATINGIPYTIDQAMPDGDAGDFSAAVGEKPILFGDFNAGYIVRQVLDVQMVRLAERYADYLQVGFFGFSRLDAIPDDTSAVKALELT
jgi:HK97 family phage major capsid protein